MKKIDKLNLEQRLAFEAVKAGWNIFITGGGGVGKSFLIDIISTYIEGVVLSAPTGIAALNISGATVHSFFGIPIGAVDIFTGSQLKMGEAEKLSSAKIILIDEVSMLSAHSLDTIDIKLRNATRINKPFGGKQVVFVGDMCQIEPIAPKEKEFHAELLEEYGSLFCFNSNAWKEVNPISFVLTEPVRHSEDVLIKTLRNLRIGNNVKKYVGFLNSNCAKDPDDSVLRLFTTNRQCDAWNDNHLANVEGDEVVYKAEIEGDFKLRPSPQTLALKVGARVIITANDVDNDDYVNGDMGTVVRLRKKTVSVKLDRGRTIIVTSKTWEDVDYSISEDKEKKLEKESNAKYSQIPLKLGYGITTHKSQGLTFDEAVIDLSKGTFSCGQAYVALSRVRTLSGLYLGAPVKPFHVKVSEEAVDYTISASKIALARRKEDIAMLGIDVEMFNKDKPTYKINQLKLKMANILNNDELSLDEIEEQLLTHNISLYAKKKGSNMEGGFSFNGEIYRAGQLYGTDIKEVLTSFNGIEREMSDEMIKSLEHNYKRLISTPEIEHPDLSKNEFEANRAEADNTITEMMEKLRKLGFSEKRTKSLLDEAHSAIKSE